MISEFVLREKGIVYGDGEPCHHPGCKSHVSHPCEGCGRVMAQGEWKMGALRCVDDEMKRAETLKNLPANTQQLLEWIYLSISRQRKILARIEGGYVLIQPLGSIGFSMDLFEELEEVEKAMIRSCPSKAEPHAKCKGPGDPLSLRDYDYIDVS
jgi:hypothetical protein